MSEHTYKVIELVGSSKTGIEEAVKNALSKASDSFRNSRWFEVTQIRGAIEANEAAYWQVGLKIGFNAGENQGKQDGGETAKRESAKQAKGSKKFRCKVCGYIYDPEKGDTDHGVNPGTAFEDLPDDWQCPECGVDKGQFEEI